MGGSGGGGGARRQLEHIRVHSITRLPFVRGDDAREAHEGDAERSVHDNALVGGALDQGAHQRRDGQRHAAARVPCAHDETLGAQLPLALQASTSIQLECISIRPEPISIQQEPAGIKRKETFTRQGGGGGRGGLAGLQ